MFVFFPFFIYADSYWNIINAHLLRKLNQEHFQLKLWRISFQNKKLRYN